MKILLAEDDFTSRKMLASVIKKWGYEVISAEDGTEAWKILNSKEPPRLAILDWEMPGLNGTEICKLVRQNEEGEEKYTFLILLTAKGEQDNIVKGMEYGADDYVIKPYSPQELKLRIMAGARILELQSALIAAKEVQERLSRTDPLTGILNRRAIIEHVEKEMSRSSREGTTMSLSMLDIDFFKKVNDTYGHAAGDAVLVECVSRMERTIRKYDLLGRIGGEEFLILLPGTGAEEALIVCEKIRKVIKAGHVNFKGEEISITVSQGVATWDGVSSVDDFIARIDDALYSAKKNGRDRVEACYLQDKRILGS